MENNSFNNPILIGGTTSSSNSSSETDISSDMREYILELRNEKEQAAEILKQKTIHQLALEEIKFQIGRINFGSFREIKRFNELAKFHCEIVTSRTTNFEGRKYFSFSESDISKIHTVKNWGIFLKKDHPVSTEFESSWALLPWLKNND